MEQVWGSDLIPFLVLDYTYRSILSIKNYELTIGLKNYELTKKHNYTKITIARLRIIPSI